ncbi:MAG: hypothetical protein AAGA54_22365 [Myxococcota bacterium]
MRTYADRRRQIAAPIVHRAFDELARRSALATLLVCSSGFAFSEEPAHRPRQDESPDEVCDQVAQRKTNVAVSTQFVEILSLTPRTRHNTTLLTVGFSVARLLKSRLAVVAAINFATGVDSVSVGGSTTLALSYQIFRSGTLKLGVGPDATLVHSGVKAAGPSWQQLTVVSGGLGWSLGYERTTFKIGVGVGYIPQFGGSWSLAPRLGWSVRI